MGAFTSSQKKNNNKERDRRRRFYLLIAQREKKDILRRVNLEMKWKMSSANIIQSLLKQ